MDGKSMFGDIKSKLGFGRKNGYEEFYEDYEEFEEGDDYGEYGYDESYERTSGSAYDPYDSVTTREPGERSRGRSSMPRLVSIDDVRARTAVPHAARRRCAREPPRLLQLVPHDGRFLAAAADDPRGHGCRLRCGLGGAPCPFRGSELAVRVHDAPGRYAPGKLARHFCLRFRFALHPLSHAEGDCPRRLQRRRGRLHRAEARQRRGAEPGSDPLMRWPSASWTSPSAWPARWMRTWNVWATRCSPSLASTSSPRPSAPTCALRASSSAWRALKTFRLRSL